MIRLDAVGAVKVYFYYDFIFNNSLSVYWWRQCLVGQPKVTAVSEATVCDVARITKYCWLIWVVFLMYLVIFFFLHFPQWKKSTWILRFDVKKWPLMAWTSWAKISWRSLLEGCKWPWVKIPGVGVGIWQPSVKVCVVKLWTEASIWSVLSRGCEKTNTRGLCSKLKAQMEP